MYRLMSGSETGLRITDSKCEQQEHFLVGVRRHRYDDSLLVLFKRVSLRSIGDADLVVRKTAHDIVHHQKGVVAEKVAVLGR